MTKGYYLIFEEHYSPNNEISQKYLKKKKLIENEKNKLIFLILVYEYRLSQTIKPERK